jgi:S-adenosylmethionine hydrolase
MRLLIGFLFFIASICTACFGQAHVLVFQSDFGVKDGAVSAMKGVAFSVSRDLEMFDLTHEIPAYNIWEAAYRLNQTAAYWPKGTVFVSVVDPGVGSERKSVVMKSKSGHYFVTPDNGTLTLVAESLGIDQVRLIDETRNRLKNSAESNTFHGRDVYAYTAARLASRLITFDEVGPLMTTDIVRISYQRPEYEDGVIRGNIDVLDIQYGNLWSNIDKKTFEKLRVKPGDKLHVKVFANNAVRFDSDVIFGNTFADVPVGNAVAYLNSLLNFSVAINQGNFSERFQIQSGPSSRIEISEVKK